MNRLQKLFDRVARHLLTQGVRSARAVGGCLYRGPDGTMCAIGCLIDNKQYSTTLENHPLTRVNAVRKAVEKSLGWALTTDEVDLLKALQVIHDDAPEDSWEDELVLLAKYHGLSTHGIDHLLSPSV